MVVVTVVVCRVRALVMDDDDCNEDLGLSLSIGCFGSQNDR